MKIFNGACEEDHFTFLISKGINCFIICNDPSSASFTSMKVIQSIIDNHNVKEIILTMVPSTIEEFEYYQKEFIKRNIVLKFLDDLIVDRKIYSFKDLEYGLSLRREIILIEGKEYFTDPRSMDYDRLSIELKIR